MKILIIRHGDPDYEHDSLTSKGWREANLLADRLCKIDIKDFYVSPLGRAKATASCTLERLNRTAKECQWLREFAPSIMRPDVTDHRMIASDGHSGIRYPRRISMGNRQSGYSACRARLCP